MKVMCALKATQTIANAEEYSDSLSFFQTINIAVYKIVKFHPIFWCENFVETHSFCRDSGDSPETVWKLCVFRKFSYQEIRRNYTILYSAICYCLKDW